MKYTLSEHFIDELLKAKESSFTIKRNDLKKIKESLSTANRLINNLYASSLSSYEKVKQLEKEKHLLEKTIDENSLTNEKHFESEVNYQDGIG